MPIDLNPAPGVGRAGPVNPNMTDNDLLVEASDRNPDGTPLPPSTDENLEESLGGGQTNVLGQGNLPDNIVIDLERGEFVERDDAEPNSSVEAIQLFINNTHHGLDDGPGEDGLYENPVEVDGLYDGDMIDAIVEVRRRLGHESPEFNPLQSGYLLGNSEEDHEWVQQAITDRERLNPLISGFGSGQSWRSHPDDFITHQEELRDFVYRNEVQTRHEGEEPYDMDGVARFTDLYLQVDQGLAAYRVAGAGNWTRTLLDAREDRHGEKQVP